MALHTEIMYTDHITFLLRNFQENGNPNQGTTVLV